MLTYTRRRRWPEAAKVPRTGDADGCLDIWGWYVKKRCGLYVINPVSGGESEKVIYSLQVREIRNALGKKRILAKRSVDLIVLAITLAIDIAIV